MGDVTGISWTDHTFNPWIGCAKVHAGCTNCYAEADFDKRRHFAKWGVNGKRVVTSDAYWKKPLKWDRDAEKEGVRRKVFCASLADVFEDRPELESWREGLFDLIDSTPNLDWQLLTKRPENIRRMLTPIKSHGAGPYIRRWPNVWLGTSISDQPTADKAIPALLKCRDLSPVLFVSAEPLLGPIDFETIRDPERFPGCAYFDVLRGRMIHEDDGYHWTAEPRIDWVIVGGESGLNARPCNAKWIAQIVDQCEPTRVACFVKQFGSNAVAGEYAVSFKDKKGGNPSEWERRFRVQQFPKASS
jgi:protein gp37